MNRHARRGNIRTPLTVMATLTVAAGLLATAVAPAGAAKGGNAPSHHRKPTVVLVHGAFADSTSWNGVVKRLKHEGYPVVAAANPLRGLKSDAAYVRELVDSIDGPVVLAAHSYGGAVITNAAQGSDNVKALVYMAAFMPDKGESAFDLADKFPGSTLGQALHEVPITQPDGSKGADLYIDQAKFHHQFAADVPEHTTDIMAVTQRPVSGAALYEPSGEPAWKTIPSWVLVASKDLNIPRDAQVFMAKRAKAHVTEVRSSHAVSVSHAKDAAHIIEEAARSVR
ncbi:alpha/beta hydrolase [Streptomyces sp. NPDC026673]|uniref:alpha/beta fold hydrolase n=1 Tax=Streptomyces sp. NPDC026673 TaxID=3155724 RepID=UPI0033C0D97C